MAARAKAARVVTVAQQKGGAGKTTVAIQLATAMAARGLAVGLIDIDPQGSLTDWMRIRQHEAREASDLAFAMIGGWRLEVELRRMRGGLDLIVVDSPPHAESDARIAIRAADLVLVPCQPSPLDVWASKATIEAAVKEGRDVRLLLNRVPPRGRVIDEALAAIGKQGYPAMGTRLGNRQAFVASLARGMGVIESEPRSAAAQEAKALAEETQAAVG